MQAMISIPSWKFDARQNVRTSFLYKNYEPSYEDCTYVQNKNEMKKFLNFYSGFETRDGCPSAEDRDRASKVFKLSITITSSQSKKRILIFFKQAGFNH